MKHNKLPFTFLSFFFFFFNLEATGVKCWVRERSDYSINWIRSANEGDPSISIPPHSFSAPPQIQRVCSSYSPHSLSCKLTSLLSIPVTATLCPASGTLFLLFLLLGLSARLASYLPSSLCWKVSSSERPNLMPTIGGQLSFIVGLCWFPPWYLTQLFNYVIKNCKL